MLDSTRLLQMVPRRRVLLVLSALGGVVRLHTGIKTKPSHFPCSRHQSRIFCTHVCMHDSATTIDLHKRGRWLPHAGVDEVHDHNFPSLPFPSPDTHLAPPRQAAAINARAVVYVSASLTSATTSTENNRSSNPIAAPPAAIFEVRTLSRAQTVSPAYSWTTNTAGTKKNTQAAKEGACAGARSLRGLRR